MNKLIFLIVLIIIVSCKTKKAFTRFYLSNDCYSSSLFNVPNSKTSEKKESIEYSSLEMIKNHNEIINESEINRSNLYDLKTNKYTNNCLNIIVDTSANINIEKKWHKLVGCSPYTSSNKNQKDTVKLAARLVYIYNPMNENAFIDVTMNNVYAIQEAKNENGDWKPIEFANLGDWCTIQTNRILTIKPKKYLKFKIIKYKGEFKTQMRLKIKSFNNVFYSNIYIGTINKSQFKMCSYMKDKEYYDPLFFNN